MIEDLEGRIRRCGVTYREFCELAEICEQTLYQWRKGLCAPRPRDTVTGRMQAVLERLERERLAELLKRYPQQQETGNAGTRR